LSLSLWVWVKQVLSLLSELKSFKWVWVFYVSLSLLCESESFMWVWVFYVSLSLLCESESFESESEYLKQVLSLLSKS